MAKPQRIKGFFITGTDTGVGKTIVTACLLSLFKKHGVDAGIMKPFETGIGHGALSDAEFLIKAAGVDDPLAEVSPVRLKTPASPLQASRMENHPIRIETVMGKFRTLAKKHELMLVEGVGGILAPITKRYMVLDLIREMNLPLIVVCRHTLGTLNHTLLTLMAAQEKNIPLKGIILNQTTKRHTDVDKDQPALLRELTQVPILGKCPFINEVSPASFTPRLLAKIEKGLDVDKLLSD